MTEEVDFSLSTLSIDSTGSQNEDWDRSLILSESSTQHMPLTATPRNSIQFPGDDDATPGRARAATMTGLATTTGTRDKRSLSELLRLHAEKGTDVKFSQEEAVRVADVLGQWINASSSPYEAEDDFFSRSQDDLSRPPKKSSQDGRPRGQSESANSRPSSSTGFAQS